MNGWAMDRTAYGSTQRGRRQRQRQRRRARLRTAPARRRGQLEPEVRVGGRRRGAPARRALEHAQLEQVGLVDVLDRVLLLADGDRERREPDRAAGELHADRAQDLAVEAVEPELVDLEQLERGLAPRPRVTTPSMRTSA